MPLKSAFYGWFFDHSQMGFSAGPWRVYMSTQLRCGLEIAHGNWTAPGPKIHMGHGAMDLRLWTSPKKTENEWSVSCVDLCLVENSWTKFRKIGFSPPMCKDPYEILWICVCKPLGLPYVAALHTQEFSPKSCIIGAGNPLHFRVFPLVHFCLSKLPMVSCHPWCIPMVSCHCFFLFGPLGSFRHTSNTFAALRTPSGSKWAHGPHVDGWLHLFQGSTGEYNHHLWIFIWIFMNITTIYGFLWIFIWIIWIS
jgi:hypothetical protein